VPLLVVGKVVGVFNVESYFMATFKAPVERDFVENCARLVARLFDRTAVPELVRV
jgi:putative methionine-R-sulfoxide reductase with GAF domain